jgi:hypothetical protein
MRYDPSEKSKVPLDVRIRKTTRLIAIIVAFLSTFIFFVKILFF